MSFTNPILTTGTASNQPSWEVVDEARHDPGTRATTQDGRSFYYACSRSASLIPAGNLLSNAPVDVDFDDLAIGTLTVGATSAAITSGSGSAKTYAANELVGGFMQTNSGTTGQGRQYRITANPAVASATATTIEFEAIREEDFNANTTVTIVPNPYSSVTISAAVTSLCIGVTSVDVPVGSTDPQYFWAQTWGVGCVLSGASGDILGHALILHTTDGASIGLVDGSSGDEPQIIGTNLFTSVSADFMPVFLQIAP